MLDIHSLKPHPVIIKDLKPENIIMTAKGRLKIIDFGIAREYSPSGKTMTHLQGFGTPGYAPPEQELGGTTPLTDIFAFGRLLYFLCTRDDPQSRSLVIFQKGGNPYEFPPGGVSKKVHKSHWRSSRSICFLCGFSNDLDAKYCNRCGSDIIRKRIRRQKCRKFCVSDAKYCTHCGKKLI